MTAVKNSEGLKSFAFLRSSKAHVLASIILKVGGAGIAFAWQWLVFRFLGASMGGSVLVAQSQMRVAGTIGSIGQDRSLSLDLPLARSKEDARARIRRAQVIGMAVTCVALLVMAVLTMQGDTPSWHLNAALIAIGSVTFCSLVMAAGTARGLAKPLAADIAFTALPLAASGIVFLILGPSFGWTVLTALLAIVAGQIFALVYIQLVIARALARGHDLESITAGTANRRPRRNFADQASIAICTTFSSMYPDVLLILVGHTSSSISAAALGIAVRYIRLARFVPVSFLHVREPGLARMWNAGETTALIREASGMAVTSFMVSVGILAVLFVFPSTFLGFFGRDLAPYVNVLQIVVVAELVNAMALMPSSLLLVTGNARRLAVILVLAYGAGLAGSLAVVPRFGGLGAALMLLATNLALGLATSFACWRLTGIRVDTFSATATLATAHWRRRSDQRLRGDEPDA